MRKRAPARTAEERQNQIIGLVMDVVEEKIRSGTASSQILTHFLKLATEKEQLENEKLRSDLKVAEAKIKQMDSQRDVMELYSKALTAMKSYNGEETEEDDLDDDE